MDPRGAKGAWEGDRLLRQPGEDARIEALAAQRAVVRGSHAVGRAIPQAGSRRRHGARDRRGDRDRRLGSADAGRHQPAQRPGDPRALRQQVGVARRTSTRRTSARRPRRCAAEFSWSADEADAGQEMGRLRAGAHDGDARGDRPRLGPDGRRRHGAAAPSCSRSSTRRSRRRAPISSRCTSCPIRSSSSWASCRRRPSPRSCATEYEQYYARNALVQLRRVREGTQIEEDHMRNRQLIVHWLLRAHRRRSKSDARDGKTYYVMVDADGVPRGRRPAAGRGAADQGRGRLRRGARARSRRTACTSIRRCATRSWRGSIALRLPSYTGFVMPRLDARRDDAGRHRRRRDFLSVRSRDPDARVLGLRAPR